MEEKENNGIGESLQILVFKLDKEEYGIDIVRISTIIEKDMGIARVPRTLPYIRGVINLRGEILPVLNLRLRLGYPEAEYDDDTRIIIIKSEDVSVGLIVDMVLEVVSVVRDDIENATDVSDIVSSEDIHGICKIDDRVIAILNVDKFVIAAADDSI